MSGSITQIISELLSSNELQNIISKNNDSQIEELASPNQDESAKPSVLSETPKSEKELLLQKKVEMLEALKPFLGDEFSKKADVVINALKAAEIILRLRQGNV